MRDFVFLAQSDTTVGFLSKNQQLLNTIKQRDENKKCILCASSYKDVNTRVPNKYKKYVRASKKITFILKNSFSFRVVKDEYHEKFIKKFKTLYSTSANLSNSKFDYLFAYENSDVIVKDSRSFFESAPSKILKIGNIKMKKLR